MRVQLKVVLADRRHNEFCGPGLIQLLKGIRRRGSIQQAAKEMRLSYVKALKILSRLEKALGQPVLIRHKGGATRGNSTLTPYALRFMRDFTSLTNDIQRTVTASSRGFIKKYKKENA
ncbi:MAG TPA: LysR family transcriptional regulator [Kiritimatiellia bacterium]|nr:LysR family transcriptional regulator [Kiritimatiellia bacterium]